MKQQPRHTILILLVALLICCEKTEDNAAYSKISKQVWEKRNSPQHSLISMDSLAIQFSLIQVGEGHKSFLIPDRKSQLNSYACSECHRHPLPAFEETIQKKAHWNIVLQHAKKSTMDCRTCHDSKSMNHLKSLTGVGIDFDRSYQLCRQCHFPQFKDWIGGAHGKQLEGWKPPRRSMTCTNCHNPHKPSIEKRWPARFNTQKEVERKGK